MVDRFNLVDEPWIPVTDVGKVSLHQVFANPQYRALGGNPVQKIALMKLLLAIAQAASSPNDDLEWKALSGDKLSERCIAYLDRQHSSFYLYGDKPFMQMPAIDKAAVQSYGAVLPEVSSGNTTVLTQSQVARSLDDADKALLLICLMGFALAGKKTDNSVKLTPAYQGKSNDKGKPSSGRPGPSVAHMGLLHSFLLGKTLQETLWLNLLTVRQVEQSKTFAAGIGLPPWEQMPTGEDCSVARQLKESLQGRLVAMCRFCLLTDAGLHYSEGLAHQGYKDGVADPTVAVNNSGKEPKALWVDPEKRPWRELTSLLSFFEQTQSRGFQSLQINACLDRARDVTDTFAIWSGGLRVSSNAGEQYLAGSDDFVESQAWLQSSMLGEVWFSRLKTEMGALNEMASKSVYGRVMAYSKELMVDGKQVAAQASHLFWQLCERNFQNLIDSCGSDEEARLQRHKLRKAFANCAYQAYDQFCPKETARQLDAWAKCRASHHQYLTQET